MRKCLEEKDGKRTDKEFWLGTLDVTVEGEGIWRRVAEFVGLLIVGGLLLYFMSDWVRRVGASVQEQPLPYE